MACADCGGPVSDRTKTGRCRKCACAATGKARRKRVSANCVDCDIQLGQANKSGRCRLCFNKWFGTNPEFVKARAEGIRRKFQDPEHRAKMVKVARRNGQKASADPKHRAYLIERGKTVLAPLLHSPEVRARNQSRETRERAARTMHERVMGWCPPEYRARYRWLVRSKRMHASDARKAVEAEIANAQALRHVENALDYLRRFAPVQRLENGYRYGTAILSPSELIERATWRGWQPERWAA